MNNFLRSSNVTYIITVPVHFLPMNCYFLSI
ncbi:hypothetical protein Hamer_G018614, partial [Homarus americanus]